MYSALFSKSVAVSLMNSAMSTISCASKPLEVTAAVPILIPLVTKGFSGSPGIAFLLTVM